MKRFKSMLITFLFTVSVMAVQAQTTHTKARINMHLFPIQSLTFNTNTDNAMQTIAIENTKNNQQVKTNILENHLTITSAKGCRISMLKGSVNTNKNSRQVILSSFSKALYAGSGGPEKSIDVSFANEQANVDRYTNTTSNNVTQTVVIYSIDPE